MLSSTQSERRLTVKSVGLVMAARWYRTEAEAFESIGLGDYYQKAGEVK